MRNKSKLGYYDVRDGLSSTLRKILKIVYYLNKTESRYCRSEKVCNIVAERVKIKMDNIHSILVDANYPRSDIPLIDGLGNFGFPPAAPMFSEIRIGSFYSSLMEVKESDDENIPLYIPFPFILSMGTIGYAFSKTKIPTHNLGEVIDATIALIQNPEISTRDIINIINGPDIHIGGFIKNPEKLYDIYEKGYGDIKIIVNDETINPNYYGEPKDYANWYGMKYCRKYKNKVITIKYNAMLYNGTTTKYMSVKEILQEYLKYYIETSKELYGEILDKETLCANLENYKKYSSERKTQVKKSCF